MQLNKIIFMTGATSGLGRISAIKAAQNGASIIVLARDKVKSQALKTEFEGQYPDSSGKIEIIEGDLNSLESVYSACKEVKLKFPVIDMIVNNAGIMNFEYKQTVDKIEETLQVNLLSPLLICHLLFENLAKSDDPKIIFTSSGLHQGEINFDNLEFKVSFSSFKVYRQSKLGVILICRLLAKTLENDGIGIYSQHPGMVRTNLGRSAGWFSKMIFYFMGKSPEKGAQTLSFLIETPNSELKSGEYYADKKITATTKESYDMEVAHKLLLTINTFLIQYVKSDSAILKEIKA
jgi:NAD(P)-dependent dehydrogenase (short-subunit alcohol dehydrogenase family)